jgi:2-methylcitrate dehydratase
MEAEDRNRTPLALRLAEAFYSVRLEDLPEASINHLKTLVLDALACVHAAPRSLVGEARSVAVAGGGNEAGQCHVLTTGERLAPAAVALVNGALLRSRDLMDVYAGADVCHPSEVIPAILAAGEHAGASGRLMLETLAAAVMLHVRLSQALPMHRYGFHHTGHAAIVAPLAVARMLGLAPDEAAAALNLASRGLLMPEGFSRGHVTNLKTYAYGLQARAAFDAIAMAGARLRGASGTLGEMISLWSAVSNQQPDLKSLVGCLDRQAITEVWLKRYPAQYALQPLIAAGIGLQETMPNVHRRITEIKVTASRRTIDRCADAAKYSPSSAETADHSLPFCVAVALVDGKFDTNSLEDQRWLDPEVAGLMARIRIGASDADTGYAVGSQSITIRLADGEEFKVAPDYPRAGIGWRQIAADKLAAYAGHWLDPSAAIETIDGIEEGSLASRIRRLLPGGS